MTRRTTLVAVAAVVGTAAVVPLTLNAAAAPPDVARISTSPTSVTDAAGVRWDADRGFAGGTSMPSVTTAPISGTADDDLYRSERYGMSGYRIPVTTPGTYRVTLRLAENYFTGVGQRVFDVAAEGGTVLDNVDIFAEVGRNAAYDPSFDVQVDDGVLDLSFRNQVNFAKLSALRVSLVDGGGPGPSPTGPAPNGTVRRVVAGGSSVTDNGGRVWGSDAGFVQGTSGVWKNPVDIAGTLDDKLFQSERFGMAGYRFPVVNGRYRVTINEAEIYYNSPGARVFSITAEGSPVRSDLDIVAAVGARAALSITFERDVTDGALDLGFTARTENAKVASISVLPAGGGPTSSPTATPTSTPTGAAGFVNRRGGRLMLNGQPKRFVGFNTNGFPHIGCGGGPSTRADVDAYFSRYTNSNTWIRTWVFPGANLAELDYEMAAAKRTGAKLIITLSNAFPYCNDPGGDKSQAWYDGGWRSTHEAHIRTVVNRYKNEPTVAFWELQNEPHGASNASIKAFFTASAGLIKSLDANHLISSGTFPPYAYGGNAGYQDVSNVPDVDILSAHTYDQGMVEPGHLRDAHAISVALNKPLYWGELGLNASSSQWASRRDQVVSQTTHAFATLPNLAGMSYWALNWQIDGIMNTGPSDPYLPGAIRDFRIP